VEVLKHLQAVKNERGDAALMAIAANNTDACIVREARSISGGRK
jgi:hypothetical protein